MVELDKITLIRKFTSEFEEPSQEEVDHIIGQLTQRKQQVEYLLKTYPQARNHDFLLTFLWLRIFAKVNIPQIHWEVICQFSGALESVRRVRQKIQNEEHHFLPTDPTVLEKRSRRSKAYRKAVIKV